MEIAEMDTISRGDLFRLGLKITGETIVSRGRNYIYLPRRYDSNPEYEQWKSSVEEISYRTGNVRMTAFLDCDPERTPDRIWLMFGGNASVALDWLPVTSFAPQSADAFALFDYPGFGDSGGKAKRELIRKCVDELIEHLFNRFSIDRELAGKRLLVMGHSLGAAIALETAERYSIKKGILVSPFVSIHRMGAMMFGNLLPYFSADRYDNLQTLRRIVDSDEAPEFHIVHGTKDDVIPIGMARELHESAPEYTTLWEIPDANHNDILVMLHKEFGKALTNGGEFSFDP